MTPIELYTYQTPNGHKASIMLEDRMSLPLKRRLTLDAVARVTPEWAGQSLKQGG
jgi:hypothetical protein